MMMTTPAAGSASNAARHPKSYELAAISPGLNQVMAMEGGGTVMAAGGVRSAPSRTRSDSNAGMNTSSTDTGLSASEPALQGFSADMVKKNVELKASVMELEDLLETTNEVQLEGVNTNRETLSERNENSVTTILEYDEEYRCPTSSQISRDKLVALLGLKMDTTMLNSQLSIMKKVTKAQRFIKDQEGGAVTSPFGQSALTPGRGDRVSVVLLEGTEGGEGGVLGDGAMSTVSQRSARTNMSSLPPEVLNVQPRIEELLAMLNQPKVPEMKRIIRELGHLLRAIFPPAGNVLATCLQNLHVTAHTDVQGFVFNQLAASEGPLQMAIANMHRQETIYEGLRAKVEEAEAKQQAKASATTTTNSPSTDDADEDDASSEVVAQYEQSIVLYIAAIERALTISKTRVNSVSMQKSEPAGLESAGSENSLMEENFRAKFENSQETSRDQVSTWRTRVKEAIEKIDHDEDKCQKEQERRDAENEAALKNFHLTKDESVTKLRDFSAQQEALWEEVAVRVAQMGDITKERSKEVAAHLERSEEEHRRRRFYDEFCALNKRHGEHMAMVKVLGEESDKILDQIANFEEHMSVLVEAKSYDDGLGDLRETEYNGFFALYTPFVTTTAVSLGIKDARKLVSEMTVGMAEQQLEAGAKSAQDKNRFTETRRAHRQILEDIRATSLSLYGRLDSWEEQFLLVKRLMGAAADHVEDPATAAEAKWATAVDKTQLDVKAAMEQEDVTMKKSEKEAEEDMARAEEAMAKLRAKREASPARRVVTRSKSRLKLKGGGGQAAVAGVGHPRAPL